MAERLIIGTRGSKLALWQTQYVADCLQREHPALTVQIRIIQTQGDATQATEIPLSSFGEKGIFAKELEIALLAGEIDAAVHSMKDLAHTLPDGLVIGAVPPREDRRDALLGGSLQSLAQGASVGTGSVRRRALLLERRPDLHIAEIRGNIDSRIRKLDEGRYDAICLAVAGLKRLDLQGRVTELLDHPDFLPDPGQGALAIEARVTDARVLTMLAAIHDSASGAETRAERAFLSAIGGSCKTPVGARALLGARHERVIRMQAMLAAPNGDIILRESAAGPAGDPDALGRRIAAALREAALITERNTGRRLLLESSSS